MATCISHWAIEALLGIHVGTSEHPSSERGRGTWGKQYKMQNYYYF